MKTSNDFNELKNFFSSYFHEDWPTEAKDPEEVISGYLALRPSAAELDMLAQQIGHFLDGHPHIDETERALFSVLGCYYQPSVDKISARLWLQGIANTFLNAAKRTS